MIKNKGRFIIRFGKEDKEFVDNLNWEKLDDGYNKAKIFFKYERDISPIKICFIYSPEEFVFFSKYKKHEKWNVAFAGNNNTIYVFAPSVVEKYTIHKNNHFFFTLIHEITHFFYRDAVNNKNFAIFPLWNEGIAEYIANRKKPQNKGYLLSTLSDFSKECTMNYKVGHLLISCIMDEFGIAGNKKIIKFLEETNNGWTQKKLFNKFEEIFGINVNKLIGLQGRIKNG